MATGLHQENTLPVPSGQGKCFGIVVSQYNSGITESLLKACEETLRAHHVAETDIHISRVPGAFELPMGAKMLMGHKKFDAVICLGCVIKGETKHDEYISQSVANGIQQLSLFSGVPVIFGLLTPNTLEQAQARAGGSLGNKGTEAAETALHMVALKNAGSERQQKIGFSS